MSRGGVDTEAGVADLAAGLRVVMSRLRRRTRVGADGLTSSQISVLVTVESAAGATLGEVAAKEGVSAPTVTRLVASLVEAGLLERHLDPADRRSSLVSLSPAGAQRLAALRREATSLLTRRLAALEPEERDLLARALPVLERIAASDRD